MNPKDKLKELTQVHKQFGAPGETDFRNFLEQCGVKEEDFDRRYGAQGYGNSIYIKDPEGNTVELRSQL